MLINGSGRHQWSLSRTQTTWTLWHKLTTERKFIDTAAPLSQPKHVLCDTQLKEVTCIFWFPKQQNNPNSLPRDTQHLLMSKPWNARMYTDGAGSPSKHVVQLRLAVGGTEWASSPTVQGLGVGWVSIAWVLITLWKLWDSPGPKAGIFTGSRVYNSTPWSCSEHHPKWWLNFVLSYILLDAGKGSWKCWVWVSC